MPLGEIAAAALVVVLRVVAEFIGGIVMEILVKGPGYIICRFFRKGIDPDGAWVLFAGVLFWLLVGAAIYSTYRMAA